MNELDCTSKWLRTRTPATAALIAPALNDIARAQNMSRLARDAKLDRAGLYKALSEEGNPSFTTVMKITRALGLRLRLEPEGKGRTERRKSCDGGVSGLCLSDVTGIHGNRVSPTISRGLGNHAKVSPSTRKQKHRP